MASFRRKLVGEKILGTMTSPQTGQVMTGSGNPALDELLGGGIPINSIILIEEDKHCVYSKVICKYFLAEGVTHTHKIFLGCLDESPSEIMKKLPKPVYEADGWTGEDVPDYEQLSMDTTSLRIAWRYNDLPYLNKSKTFRTLKNHHFNLLIHMSEEYVNGVIKVLWDGSETDEKSDDDSPKNETPDEEEGDESSSASAAPPTNSVFTNQRFQKLIDALSNSLGPYSFFRICIPSLGSPLWYEENFSQDLLKFLTILRAIVQNTKCACMLTMPMHLIAKNDETLVPKIRNLVDYAIELEPFAGSDRETNPAFKEYNGMLHFRKMSAINSIALFQHSDLAFKLRRKKFVIEKFHLPPELDDNTEQDSDEVVSKPTTASCANIGSSNPLDF